MSINAKGLNFGAAYGGYNGGAFATAGASRGTANAYVPVAYNAMASRPLVPQKPADLFGLGVCNYRVDAGSNNLVSQKVSIDWPQFRPTNAIFKGPTVRQDLTDQYMSRMNNVTFEGPGGLESFIQCFDNAGGFGGGFGGNGVFGGNQNGFGSGGYIPGGINGGGNKGPFDGAPRTNPKGGSGEGSKGKGKELSGKGSIEGTSFRSADGESYKLNLVSGKNYNLLADKGISLNGTFNGTSLSAIGMNVGGETLTFNKDGLLMIGDKAFSATRNSMGGKVTKSGDTYTVTTGEYTVKLSKSGSGVRVGLEARNAGGDGVRPDGLWGSTLDGLKQKGSDIEADLMPRDYIVNSLVDFGGKADDTERQNQLVWQSINPKVTGVNLSITGNTASNGTASYSFTKLSENESYNLFSDLDLQVTGKFAGNKVKETSVLVDGEKYTFKLDSAGAIKVYDEDENELTASTGKLVKNANGTFTINSGNSDGQIVAIDKNGADLRVRITGNAGTNGVRSSGFLGELVGVTADLGNDDNGLGYLRNAEGAKLLRASEIEDALEAYILDAFETDGGRSVYNGY